MGPLVDYILPSQLTLWAAMHSRYSFWAARKVDLQRTRAGHGQNSATDASAAASGSAVLGTSTRAAAAGATHAAGPYWVDSAVTSSSMAAMASRRRDWQFRRSAPGGDQSGAEDVPKDRGEPSGAAGPAEVSSDGGSQSGRHEAALPLTARYGDRAAPPLQQRRLPTAGCAQGPASDENGLLNFHIGSDTDESYDE